MEYSIKNKQNKYESIEFKNMVGVIQTLGKGVTLKAKVDDGKYTDFKAIPSKNTVTQLDMSMWSDLKLESKYPFEYVIPGILPHYYNKHKIEDFLYEIDYGNIDYDYAYENINHDYTGGCSSIRKGCWFGRNFDWYYDNQVLFIVHTPPSSNRHAVLGVSGIIPGIEKDTVDLDEVTKDGIDMFKLLPFYLLDGVNDKGLFCALNLVPSDGNLEIVALVEEKDRVCAAMLVRFILDKFSTAKEAIDYLTKYTTIYFPDSMLDKEYLSHFIIGDATCTYIIEFIYGVLEVVKANYITNFNIFEVEFNKDNTIKYPPTLSGIHLYGSGLERWDIISNLYKHIINKDDMRTLLTDLYFSNAYKDDFWYSELVKLEDDDGGVITVDTLPDKCTEAKTTALEAFSEKDRDNPTVWITNHSSIYNINKKELYITNQEENTEYKFTL